MIEITSLRLEEGPRDFVDIIHGLIKPPKSYCLYGKWKSNAPRALSDFRLEDCPPFYGWLYSGEAHMTSMELGGMEGEFVTDGVITKIEER